MKKMSVKTVVAIGIGAALFFVLGNISIPTPVPNTYASLQYAIQAVFAGLFGPIAGLVIGLIGQCSVDFTAYGPWWSWIIASGMFGPRRPACSWASWIWRAACSAKSRSFCSTFLS